MSDKRAIQVEGLWKEYRTGGSGPQHETLYDMLAHTIRAPFSRSRGAGKDGPDRNFWALSDINFEVKQGEVVGIIGRNGAGKSTLLKILSRITAPTRGRLTVKGRLASLLEVGTGFHQELSGRENIFLNGAILGMTRAEISRNFDEIVQFAEITDFVDTPVKRYSSGMYVRLAFAVAAYLDVDVLIVDEVLAVGDASFQEKCLKKMEDVSRAGRTVLFVSHNLGAVSRLCQRGLVLGAGRLQFDGPTDQAIAHYTRLLSDNAGLEQTQLTGTLGEKIVISRVAINGSADLFGGTFLPGEKIEVAVRGVSSEPIPQFRLTVALRKQGLHVVSLHDLEQPRDLPAGEFESTVCVPAFHLPPGPYTVEIGAFSTASKSWLWATNIGGFSIVDKWYPAYDTETEMGAVNLPVWGSRQERPSK